MFPSKPWSETLSRACYLTPTDTMRRQSTRTGTIVKRSAIICCGCHQTPAAAVGTPLKCTRRVKSLVPAAFTGRAPHGRIWRPHPYRSAPHPQGNRVNGLGSVRATEFRTTRLYRTPIMGACGCTLDQNFASCESQTPSRVTTSRLDSAFVPSPDSPVAHPAISSDFGLLDRRE